MNDPIKIPEHIAIIMDGNGRWARAKGWPRLEGHRSGIQAVRDVVRACGQWGVKFLTLYSFSAENWKRPGDEVKGLMFLLKTFLKMELNELMKNRVRLMAIGRLDQLPADVRKELASSIEKTKNNSGLSLVLALSYGGRSEIVDAVRRVADDIKSEKLQSSAIDETSFSNYLYTQGIPDPDLLVRTSGELRISNFLLWQISYAEIWVTETLWPDFKRDELWKAIEDFSRRQRRFGEVV
ncbi:MAG: isoprenyl transferase [Chlamydiae bacterium]|nr:isoprenyl transferase [Chlamydiota bacterium]MBI3265771.1 isoprenyl transferase [Chlamydiota bacterium]